MKMGVLISLMFFAVTTRAATLKVLFQDLRSDQGSIRYILFDGPQGYPEAAEKGIRQGSLSARQSQDGLVLTDLASGSYAMTFIHDENDNEKLETNFMGLPQEGFAFSTNPRIYFGSPSFDRMKFNLKENKTLKIKMKYF
jgi:uncharacterized protein (DUF2141 family)